jgi:hypothetical protein
LRLYLPIDGIKVQAPGQAPGQATQVLGVPISSTDLKYFSAGSISKTVHSLWVWGSILILWLIAHRAHRDIHSNSIVPGGLGVRS